MRLAVALLVAACAMAGCAGGGPGAPAGGSAGPAAAVAPEPSVQEFAFALGAAAGIPVVGAVLPVDDQRSASFEVPEGSTRLEATVEWTCGVPAQLCGLDVELRRGEQELQTAGFGASPLELSVDGPEEGRWTFWAFPSGQGSAVVDLQGTLTVRLS